MDIELSGFIDAGASDLQKALPTCEINSSSSCEPRGQLGADLLLLLEHKLAILDLLRRGNRTGIAFGNPPVPQKTSGTYKGCDAWDHFVPMQ